MDMLDKIVKDLRLLPDALQCIRDGLMVVDSKGCILLFNRAAEEMTGYRQAEVLGKDCSLFHCDPCLALDESGRQRGENAALPPTIRTTSTAGCKRLTERSCSS